MLGVVASLLLVAEQQCSSLEVVWLVSLSSANGHLGCFHFLAIVVL